MTIETQTKAPIIPPDILDAEDFLNLYTVPDVQAFIQLILRRYASLTIYIIEPYVAQSTEEPLKIPAGDNYNIYDYGGRIVITPIDLFSASLFASGQFLEAVEQALQMLIDADVTEIALLGDQRAKLFVWDLCDRLHTFENKLISLINFTPPDTFITAREAYLRYLQSRGLKPKVRNLAQISPSA